MKPKPSLALLIRRWAFFLLIALATVLVFAHTIKTFKESESRAVRMRAQYIDNQRKIIKSEAINFAMTIEHEMEKSLQGARTQVKARVRAAHAMARNIYEQNRGSRPESEIQKIIIDGLRPMRLDQVGGYYFIVNFDGIIRLFADRPDQEQVSSMERQDTRGNYVVKEMIDIARSKGEGCYSYYWSKPGQKGNDYKKMAYVKGFAPFGWVIGTGVYLDDLESDMHRAIIQYARHHRFGPNDSGYVFAYELLDIQGGEGFARIYANPNQTEATGKLISDNFKDARGKAFRKEFLKGLRETGECYVDYWYEKLNNPEPRPKTSFFKLAGNRRFVVAAGIYLDDVESRIRVMQADLDRELRQGLVTICGIFTCALIVVLMLAGRLNRRLKNDFEIFASFFRRAAETSKPIDKSNIRFSELDWLAGFANRMILQTSETEKDLKETQARLTQAQLMARVGHYLYDVKNDTWTSSEALDLIFGVNGFSHKDISKWLETVHPEDREKMSAYLTDHVLTRHEKFDMEYRIIDPATGREKWVHGLGNLKLDEAGEPVEMFGTIQDITERRQIGRTLRLTRFIFDRAAVGILQIASDGRILNANEKAAGDLGYTVEELSGMTVFDINPAITPDDTDTIWQPLLEKGCDSFETTHRHRDGHLLHVEVISNLMEYGGELISISFVKDITERKIAEKKKKELESRLLQSQKMETIGTLAGGIAHDFNNILSGIMGYSQLAASHMDDPERAARHIRQIIKGCHRATDLTKQILTFSRQSEYEKHPFQIYVEIKEALKLIRSSIPSTIEIVTRLESKQKVLADPVKIHQVVMNLCTNAHHAMRKAGGRLTVSLTDISFSDSDRRENPKKVPGQYVRLEIRDTGQGMDENMLEKVFEPYFTTKEKGDGTGLGLALVQAIVEEHDGFLEVSSAVGKGTCFDLYFPAVRETAGKAPEEKEPETRISGTETIMLVDDEDQIRESFKESLEDCGYRVRTFSNGRDALDAFRSGPDEFDFIITDMTMPGFTGDRLAGRILEIRPDIPVVLCTGFNDTISRAEAIDSGIREYIQKPILYKDLARLIRLILDAPNQQKT